jgi:hypothetical protein
MPTALELCLKHIDELELRIADLELDVRELKRRPVATAPAKASKPSFARKVRAVNDDDDFDGFPEILDDAGEPEPLPETIKVEARAAVEDIPRVMHRIRMMWFYPECEDMLDKLIIDDRGNRAGFSKEVMEELLFLASLSRSVKMHSGFVKPTAQKRADVWHEQRHLRVEK